jgi:hypothetical protein
MEVVERGKIIAIHADQRLPIGKMLVDLGIVVILIWVVFVVLILFFSRTSGEILPYFIAITLLLLLPFVGGILIRKSRQFSTVLFDGDQRVLSVRGIWRSHLIPFDQIQVFQINGYRFRRSEFLYRLEVVLSTGKVLRLIQDVPDQEVLSSLGEKVGRLVQKPFNPSSKSP